MVTVVVVPSQHYSTILVVVSHIASVDTFASGAPCVPTFSQLNDRNGEMEECTRVKSFDYFSGSEAAYVLTLLFVLGSVIRKHLASSS